MLNFCSSEQIIAAARDVQEKKEKYAPYNILPLDSAGGSQAIMQLEEVLSLLYLLTCFSIFHIQNARWYSLS